MPINGRRPFSRDFGGPSNRRTRVNHMIRISPIRVIDENNEQLGVMETSEALRRAESAGLDLVEISPEASPPVCKIMDYGKFKYEQSKKEQKSRAASKQQEMKEVRLGRSIKIDPHDVQIRIDQARRFLMEGHKVLLVQQFRGGREMMHRGIARELIDHVITSLADLGKVEVMPKSMGRRTTLIIAPDKAKVEAAKRKLEKERAASGDKGKGKPEEQRPDGGDAPEQPVGAAEREE